MSTRQEFLDKYNIKSKGSRKESSSYMYISTEKRFYILEFNM